MQFVKTCLAATLVLALAPQAFAETPEQHRADAEKRHEEQREHRQDAAKARQER